jgi:hypothetical protein
VHLETNDEIRPTTAQWLRSLITSVSRPATTTILRHEVVELDDDNPTIIDLNQTTNASSNISNDNNTASAPSTSFTIITNENGASLSYEPSFYQTTRLSRRHLFSRIQTRIIGIGRPEVFVPESDSRSSTAFSFNSPNTNLGTLNISNDPTIINVERLSENQEIVNEENGCVNVIQTEARSTIDDLSSLPPSSTLVVSDTQSSTCQTTQVTSIC